MNTLIWKVYLFLFVSLFLALPSLSLAKGVDDWKYTPPAPSEGGLSGYYPSLWGEVRDAIFNAPIQEYWYWYLFALLIAALYVIPIVMFFRGAWIFFKNVHDRAVRSRGTHEMALRFPAVLLPFALVLGLLYANSQLSGSQSPSLLEIVTLIAFFTLAASILALFVRRLYVLNRYRKDLIQKKRGRAKTLSVLYYLVLFLVPLAIIYFLSSGLTSAIQSPSPSPTGSFSPLQSTGSPQYFSAGSASPQLFEASSPQYFGTPSSGDESIGLSVGGAKDVNNFRENIKNGFVPLPTDVTHEGLFYDYRFDTGISEPCQKLFCPSYTTAVSKDPFSKKDEYFLAVGLNSGIQQKDFSRKKLNLLIVLDISGSMSSTFDSYYYDRVTKPSVPEDEEDDKESQKSKMEVATKSIVALLDHLKGDDRFGMVLFDDAAYIGKPLRTVESTDMARIKSHISDLQPQGGTDMSAGMKAASELFEEFSREPAGEYENRIIFLTDAMPNTGDISEEGMMGRVSALAQKNIYTTFIGIGVDFNTELIESITKIRGANYYSVHSAPEFKKRMDTNFDFMVTPLVFNFALTVTAPGFKIEKVYGSPEANEATGEIMKVNTLFPSERTEGETRGGLVLLQLKKISDDSSIALTASYEDREGKKESASVSTAFKGQEEYYDSSGIRKGIVLSRYANLLRDWMFFERASSGHEERRRARPTSPVQYYDTEGIPVVSPEFTLGIWERESQRLRVSSDFKTLFDTFKHHIESEYAVLKDESLKQEIDLFALLLTTSNKEPSIEP